LQRQNKEALLIEEPSLIFYPRPTTHRLVADESAGAEIVCATVEIGAGPNNPIANALPESIVIPLSTSDNLAKVTHWLFEEAFLDLDARQVMLDRLAEIIVIQLLRLALTQEESLAGLLRGLVHPQLGKLIKNIHRSPARQWRLEDMAKLSLMSRSKFAQTFKDTLGQTPADYLLEWRISLAQTYLRKGHAVNLIAHKVGYPNSSTFSRAFKKKTGYSPTDWHHAFLTKNEEDRGVVEHLSK